ncbi:MAG: SAM-dependent methyltransferase, partial [Terriglobia bacterium]
ATFALDGPEKCSGLDVCRYDGATLAAALGKEFSLLKSERELHLTPRGKPQSFQYSLFRRV